MTSISPSKDSAKAHGFSLIEAAIVLGIVGLVIGGIWVAASTVNNQLKLSKTMEGTIQIIDNI